MCIIYFFQGTKAEIIKEEEDIIVENTDNVVETVSAPELSNIEVKEEEPPREKVKRKKGSTFSFLKILRFSVFCRPYARLKWFICE